MHAIGVYIHFLIIDGYNTLPSEGVVFLYNDKDDNVFNICTYILLASIIFMNRIYKNNHKGTSRLLTHFFSILLPLALIIPFIIRFPLNMLGHSMWFVTSFPVGMQILEGLAHMISIVCTLLLVPSVVISLYIFFKEEKYIKFVKYWGVIFFLNNLGGIRLFLAILSYKFSAFLCGFIIIGISIIILQLAIKHRCPNCKKFSSMKYIGTSLLKEEEISIKVENATRDSIGNLTGTNEQYIPGKRKVFIESYQCKHCGYTQTKTVTKEITSI